MKLFVCCEILNFGELRDIVFFKDEDTANTYCDLMTKLFIAPESTDRFYNYYELDTETIAQDDNFITDGRRNYCVIRDFEGKYSATMSSRPLLKISANEISEFESEETRQSTFCVMVLANSRDEALDTGKRLIETYIESKNGD